MFRNVSNAVDAIAAREQLSAAVVDDRLWRRAAALRMVRAPEQVATLLDSGGFTIALFRGA
jgi:hypothetical protein